MARPKSKITTKTQLYREYNKYVTSINKQLKELEKEIPDSVAISRYKGEYRRLKTTKGYSRQDIVKLHAKARELAESGRLDVENENRSIDEAINTFNKWGYKSVNRSNIFQVFKFLEDTRARGIAGMLSSERIMKDYKKAYKNNKLTDDDLKKTLEQWL